MSKTYQRYSEEFKLSVICVTRPIPVHFPGAIQETQRGQAPLCLQD